MKNIIIVLKKQSNKSDWLSVCFITFSVVILINGEFLPVSLLTRISFDLNISEGLAGQAVTISSIIAVFSSLFITNIILGLNRRVFILILSFMQVMSFIFVAFATNYWILLIGRIFLGFTIGGFWSLSNSIAMRLVLRKDVSRALSIISLGVSIGMLTALPIGVFLGGIIGW